MTKTMYQKGETNMSKGRLWAGEILDNEGPPEITLFDVTLVKGFNMDFEHRGNRNCETVML